MVPFRTLRTLFLSTLSLRRATNSSVNTADKEANFYPRSPCGERRRKAFSIFLPIRISIHALLAESDTQGVFNLFANPDFYPRSPCGERRQAARRQTVGTAISIHALLAESDTSSWGCKLPKSYFYPRSPCGERPAPVSQMPGVSIISIHALLAESDGCRFVFLTLTVRFLSTLSLRRATEVSGDTWQRGSNFYPRSPCGERLLRIFHAEGKREISIHALLAESDKPLRMCHRVDRAFLSTLSLRRATSVSDSLPALKPFLSTLSLRRATRRVLKCDNRAIISIHALLAESDRLKMLSRQCRSRFLSTLSLRRATTITGAVRVWAWHFYPRSPCGERHGDDLYTLPLTHFYPRSPCGERRIPR